ncbi:MAG TPA: glycogen synthase GlgA [Candidatus Omnitrophota bacterium]|nr:glycogen synthase GlgA [Candidatus Omnitrophota bacterium]HPD85031.1 glycogen synthase GlgA [Candidatus Omnitrophota bacterium]HRZ03889.1 glycogen synthase GlgA [Candidatus Omnitrophota bacterium]
MRILFCSSEVGPFAQTGGLGDVCGTLPLALEKRGIEVSIMLPLYKCVDRERFNLNNLGGGIFKTKIGRNIEVYFVENDALYGRDGLYGDKSGDYEDNLDRFAYYCRKGLAFIKENNLKFDIIHCHDWQAALIPAYLKSLYRNDPFFKDVKSILTIHNLAFQGLFEKEEYPKLGLPEELYGINGFEFYELVNLLKGGIAFSDMVTTVSKRYAKEIQTYEFGCGLEGVLKQQKTPVVGILNGIDYALWDPKTDSSIAKKYSPENIEDKAANKIRLQQISKLPLRADVTLFGFVGRLSTQKGLDLVIKSITKIAKLDVQMVFLGTGDERYRRILEEIAYMYPKKIASFLEFNERIAHQIYAGSDVFLMPSTYEPCGLSQMISLKYGTIPLVFKTGGLADTIVSFDGPKNKGNGFVFEDYKKEALIKTIQLAMKIHKDKKQFRKLIQRAFKCDFSWDKSAKEYEELYQKCLSSV